MYPVCDQFRKRTTGHIPKRSPENFTAFMGLKSKPPLHQTAKHKILSGSCDHKKKKAKQKKKLRVTNWGKS